MKTESHTHEMIALDLVDGDKPVVHSNHDVVPIPLVVANNGAVPGHVLDALHFEFVLVLSAVL
mgnify:FL=1